MHPVLSHRLAVAGFALRDFVLVVRELQVEPAAVNVERFAKDRATHRAALDVPARTALAPRRVPRRFVRFRRLPKREVERRTFQRRGSAAVAGHLREGAVRQLPVFREFFDLEVDVAARLVSEALGDQVGGEVDNFADVVGRLREDVDRVDAHRGEVRFVVGGHFVGDGAHRNPAFLRLGDQFVVDVGDVDDPSRLETGVRQVAFDRVENDRADHMPDVARLVNGRAAEVHADFARRRRLEFFFRSRQRIKNSNHRQHFRGLIVR